MTYIGEAVPTTFWRSLSEKDFKLLLKRDGYLTRAQRRQLDRLTGWNTRHSESFRVVINDVEVLRGTNAA